MPAELDFKEIEKLERNIARLPNVAEQVINQTLDKQGSRIVVEEITKLIKVGQRGGSRAKHSKWEKVNKFNLGFDVVARGGAAKNKGSYGYLVFPNEGRGPRNPQEQRFAERGLELAEPKIVDVLNIDIQKKIQEVL